MGEGNTPLVPVTCGGRPMLAKVEYASPTLSFKDRGAAMVIAAAVDRAEQRVVADSSGNAGTAFAAYAARAGIECEVFVAASTRRGKLAAMRAHGATVHEIDGTRNDVAAAAIAEVDSTGAFYASHVWNPWFAEGTKKMVLELDTLPDALVLPFGNGTLILGAARAFATLSASTRVIAVRAADDGTIADGIAIASPPRFDDVARVVDASGGEIVTVTDEEILVAQADLAAQGFFVEPTAAVAPAAAARVPIEAGSIVVPLCGAGLKAVA
jgi:threonine synthase